MFRQLLPNERQRDWEAFAGRLIGTGEADGPAGIIVVETSDGMIRGGFIYAVEVNRSRVLNVRYVAIPPLGQSIMASVIHDAVARLARTRGCSVVHIEIPKDAQWQIDYFTQRGHVVSPVDIVT